MNPHLLNKIQAVKTLRDRAATDGEKDAAQHKLTILLAKHKLTEQDIPLPNFSTRGRHSASDPYVRWARERRQSSPSSKPPKATKPKRMSGRERFEKALGKPVSDATWRTVKRACIEGSYTHVTLNYAAFSRAFYEHAGYLIRARVTNTSRYCSKAKNEQGRVAALEFSEHVNLAYFRTASSQDVPND